MLPPIGDEQVTGEDIGAVDVFDIIRDGEPKDNGLKVVISNEPAETPFGEGIAEPVEA